jgi:outer membrane receptor for monomeric catechols
LVFPANFIFLTFHIKMAKARVKKRTHQKPQNASAVKGSVSSMSKTPKSMVIRVGASQVGSSVTQLVKDVRRMMEPDTAVRLKVWFTTTVLQTRFNRRYRNANPTDCEIILL